MTAGESEINENLIVNRVERRVHIRKEGTWTSVKLTPIEYGLLECLLASKNQILTRKDLIGRVWSPGSDISNRVVDTHVCTLRRKLGPIGRDLRTIFNEGYVLVAS